MPATDSIRRIHCPKCAALFEVPASMAGRRARCAACETAFEIPAAGPPETDPSLPEFVSVDCRVCGTRLTGRSAYIGKKVKCPDCGAGTELPPPPPPKPKNMPAALEGEQYELWDPDDQPLPSVIAAAQPRFIDVVCDKCGTRMYANEIQAGQKIACPDCGTKTTIPFKPRPVKKRSVLATDRDTPQVDPTTIPGDVPHVMPKTHGITLAEQEAKDEYERALERSRRTGKPMEIDERGRPVMPKHPLITGVLPFLTTAGVPAVWLGLSASFMAAGWIFITGLQMAMTGGFGAVGGMCFLAVGCVLLMLASSACSSLLIQVVTESSNGNRSVYSWPTFLDWFGSLPYVIVGGMMSAVPGWAIGLIPPIASSPGMSEIVTAISVGVCFPIALLSHLDCDTPLGVASGRVLSSLRKCPFSWAFFYIECAIIVAICYIVTVLVVGGPGEVVRTVTFRGQAIRIMESPLTFLWLVPLYVLALIIMARLLGRLGWRLAEAMPLEEPPREQDEEVRPRGQKNYNPPRQPRKTS